MSKQISDFKEASKEVLAALSSYDSPRLQAAADRLTQLIQIADQFAATPGLIEAARDLYGIDDIEVDDDATTSPGDNGTWVSAWVWVPKEETE